MASVQWSTLQRRTVIHASRAHKVLPRLVLRPFQAAVPVDISADVNVAQLVGTQSGEPVVPMYNWATFLEGHFRTVPQLKRHQHFMFSSQHPGVVTMKQFSDSASTTFSMLVDHEWYPTALELPPVISPVGLSCTRQWYSTRQKKLPINGPFNGRPF